MFSKKWNFSIIHKFIQNGGTHRYAFKKVKILQDRKSYLKW